MTSQTSAGLKESHEFKKVVHILKNVISEIWERNFDILNKTIQL